MRIESDKTKPAAAKPEAAKTEQAARPRPPPPPPAPIKTGLKDLFDGAKKVVGGIVDGAKAVAEKFVDTFAKQVTDLAKKIEAGIDSLKITSTKLSDAQQQMLKNVYGQNQDFSNVRVAQMPPWMEAACAKADELSGGSGQARSFTAGNVIFMPKADYDKFVAGQHDNLLVHETAHVLQYRQRGADVAVESLKEQMKEGSAAYNWKDNLAAGQGWKDLNVEEQASVIDNAQAAGYFDKPGQRLIVDENGTGYRVIGPGEEVPKGWKDVTNVLEDGLRSLGGNRPTPGDQSPIDGPKVA